MAEPTPTINEMSDDDIKVMLANVASEYEKNNDYLTELNITQLLNLYFGIKYLSTADPVDYNTLSKAHPALFYVAKASESELEDRMGQIPIQYNDIP